MLARVYSGATVGLESVLIEVEVDIASQGLPSFTIVGLGDKAVGAKKNSTRVVYPDRGHFLPPGEDLFRLLAWCAQGKITEP